LKQQVNLERTMKRLFHLILILAGINLVAYAQMPAAITIEPPDATAYDELTLIFDPAMACFESGSLMGLPSVAIHSGVTYITGETWQNVINFDASGMNGQLTTLYPTGDGRYSITYIPAEFYGLTGQVVTQICAVFNNGANWNQDGRDFIPNSSYCMDFFIPVNFEITTSEIYFDVNMNKMIADGNFDPESDLVYLSFDQTATEQMYDDNQDGIYSVMLDEGIEAGQTYEYRYRINDDFFETVTREITVVAGVQYVYDWWNDEMLGGITLVLDMNYQVLLGNFDPVSDFIDIAGTMNGWQGSLPMPLAGDNIYAITLYVDPGLVEYKFRINGDWATSEFPAGGPNRMTWAISDHVVIYHFYDDYNPDTHPVIFEVDMNNEIQSGNFNPSVDYLDIAGSMNGWEGHLVLIDRDWTAGGIYTTKLLIDKYNPNIEFKFRINGDWTTSEFPEGGPNRFTIAQDTAGGFINLYSCTYNITDVPFPPYVFNIYIEGDLLVGEQVNGQYTYFDPNADPEGESLYQWYFSEDPTGIDIFVIEGAVNQEYVIQPENYGKYLIFMVTPVSATGEPSMGYPQSTISGPVGATTVANIHEHGLYFYPNPATDHINISGDEIFDRVQIFDTYGKQLFSLMEIHSKSIKINLTDFAPGIYFMRSKHSNGEVLIIKFLKI
jgi:hypothetical protein